MKKRVGGVRLPKAVVDAQAELHRIIEEPERLRTFGGVPAKTRNDALRYAAHYLAIALCDHRTGKVPAFPSCESCLAKAGEMVNVALSPSQGIQENAVHHPKKPGKKAERQAIKKAGAHTRRKRPASPRSRR